MAEKNVVDGEIVQEEKQEQQEPKVVAEVHIGVLDNGGISLHVPEGSRELQPIEIEMLTRNVSEQLRDARIAQQAVELFKAKL